MDQKGEPAIPDEVSLTGRLSEFRIALREEIEAACRNEASSAVSLINGRRIAQVGGNYQYIFDVENILNLPSDTPGVLLVPGRSSLAVTVISTLDIKITLSVPSDLGVVVPNARLQSNLAQLMRRLIERIENMADKQNPVGDRILEPTRATGIPIAVEYEELNAEQLHALSCSLGRATTFIWGPPGTGKTRTIGAIAHCLYRRHRSVLLVSHTNAAVDQALLRIANAIGDPSELYNGQVIRVGDPQDVRLYQEDFKELLLKTHVDRRSADLAQKRDICKAEIDSATEIVIDLSRTIDIAEWTHEAWQDIQSMVRELSEIQTSEALLEEIRKEESVLVSQTAEWLATSEAAREAVNRLNRIADIKDQISEADAFVTESRLLLANASDRLNDAESVLIETISVSWLTRRWRGLPPPAVQEARVDDLRSLTQSLQSRLEFAEKKLVDMQAERNQLQTENAKFCEEYGGEPDDVLRSAMEHPRRLREVRTRIDQILRDSATRRVYLENLLSQRLAVLKDLGLAIRQPTDAIEMLDAIVEAYCKAQAEVASIDLPTLKKRRIQLNDRIRDLQRELEEVEESLRRVEEFVISGATIVATTLTRAYLRDSIQSRSFDTVILDEASMAPIPALWVAASIAATNAVVVGDFKQLAPIVISEHDAAQKWLGRDIFQVAGLNGACDATGLRVDLLEQRRMHPDISKIPNHLIYNKKLRDGVNMSLDGEDGLRLWYRADWRRYDNPVLLVDTGPLGAWVTSVSRSGRASRLNFLSATICVDIAEQLLKSDRNELLDGEAHRILITCPYKPHAQLLKLLIKDQDLIRDVNSGTAHGVQGSEADVVILDLVNDEPHWRVKMFMLSHDEEYRRLLNVALTRAKRRLIVVGNFKYIQKKAKHAFAGRDLIPFLLEHYPCVDAREVVPTGLAARAAIARNKVTGGSVEANADRIVETQEKFYPMLAHDFETAQKRIVIYSPFITLDRLGYLEPLLRAAIEREVRVYVVTKARSDRRTTELSTYRKLEKALEDWGVIVVHKKRMHEKLVFIDEAILWAGSLNPLSFSNTQENMERRRSKDVVRDYSQKILLDDLLYEYSGGTPRCPICGSEIVASEGRDQPFFWTCIQPDCYSRSVDQPRLTDGLIVCANCAGPVEFGNWGDRPVWRCKNNHRHHQRIAGTHLRLPKMRDLVPKGELSELEKMFGVKHVGAKLGSRNATQMNLFDLIEK